LHYVLLYLCIYFFHTYLRLYLFTALLIVILYLFAVLLF